MKHLEFIPRIILYLNIITISLSMYIKAYVLNRHRTKLLIGELNSFLKKYNHTLNGEQINRIHFYTIQSCITNSWFCQLRGKNASTSEIRKAIYMGALTPLLDDLVDSEKMNSNQILDQIKFTEDESSVAIQIISYLYHKITIDCHSEFNNQFNNALLAQDASLKQLEKEKLNHNELLQITTNKGSNWTMLYRAILQNPINAKERESITTLGTLMQLTNDVFDVYKDYQNGQQSMYTNANDLEPLYQHFNQLTHQMIAQFMETEYSKTGKKKAIIQMMLIISRGVVCLEQLLHCQKKTGNQFKIEAYSRKELICDMEKMGNVMKCLRICYKYSFWL